MNVNLYTLYEKNSCESVGKTDNMNELFIKDKIQMANKHKKIFPISVIILNYKLNQCYFVPKI